MPETETPKLADENTTRTPDRTLALLKLTALVTLLSTVAQPILAGFFLDNNVPALGLHHANAGILHLLQLVQLVAAWLYWRPGGGSSWPLLAATVLWFLASAQFAVGEEGNLSVHVPLGTLILLAQGCFTIWALRQRRPGQHPPSAQQASAPSGVSAASPAIRRTGRASSSQQSR